MNEWEAPLVFSLIHSSLGLWQPLFCWWPTFQCLETPYWDPRLFYGEERALSRGSITSLISKQQDPGRIDLGNREHRESTYSKWAGWALWLHGVTLKPLSTNCSPGLVPDILPLGIHSSSLSLRDLFTFKSPHSPNWGFCLQQNILTDRVGSLPLYDLNHSNTDVLWRLYSAIEHNLHQRNRVRDRAPRNLRSWIMRTYFSS